MKPICPDILAAVAGVAAVWLSTVAPAATLSTGTVAVTITPAGAGFVDAIAFGGRNVCQAPAGFSGAALALVPAGGASVEALFASQDPLVLTGRIVRAEEQDGVLSVDGLYTDGGALAVPFQRRFAFDPATAALRFSETTDYAKVPAAWRVAWHALRVPLVVTNDMHVRMFGLGCANRAELFRMDMNDFSRREQLISAPRGHWPYWDIGGVLQLPGSYRVWKANHADTPAYVLQEGPGAPGWADYAELDWGVTAIVDNPAASAPWALTIDARQGVFTLEPYPAAQPAVSGTALGRRTFSGELRLHAGSWPATVPCELDFATYRALINDLDCNIDSLIGTKDPDAIMYRERLQPSTLLRLTYRGDAWRMAGRVAKVGISATRSQALEKWERDASRYLDVIRTNGLPPKVKK